MPKSFRESFKNAKKNGTKTFSYNGKRYSTRTAEEAARAMSTEELSRAWYDKFTSRHSKSNQEIEDSYAKELKRRRSKK